MQLVKFNSQVIDFYMNQLVDHKHTVWLVKSSSLGHESYELMLYNGSETGSMTRVIWFLNKWLLLVNQLFLVNQKQKAWPVYYDWSDSLIEQLDKLI